ncbi:cell division protein FtsL [Paraburkholderia youngii]
MTNAPDLKRVPHAVQGYIHDLEERVAGDTKRIGELSQRIEQLEE